MIQGGDPATSPEFSEENFDKDHVVQFEYKPNRFHKKGAVAAARLGDNINPEKNSSGYQFYIVQGKVLNDTQLGMIENKINADFSTAFVHNIVMEKANKLMDKGVEPDLSFIYFTLKDSIDNLVKDLEPIKFSTEQIEMYKTIGGTPHLDWNYTVFGEVIEGMDVVDSIAATETDNTDKPLKDIRITSIIVE